MAHTASREPIARQNITGLVLAGGQARRMGGVDKGLAPLGALPLALHAARRLAPQVGAWAINANRHLALYAAWGAPVWPDDIQTTALTAYAGPLAGFLAGLHRCESDYLVTVPCDVPGFPTDLVHRLGLALVAQDADLAMAATQGPHGPLLQPVFCLMKRTLAPSLSQFLRSGRHKVTLWTAQHRCAEVVFEDEDAFFNVNTPEDLQQAALRAG
jgi:molybdopterin-guanine dinucleotide biosynthesis protein A